MPKEISIYAGPMPTSQETIFTVPPSKKVTIRQIWMKNIHAADLSTNTLKIVTKLGGYNVNIAPDELSAGYIWDVTVNHVLCSGDRIIALTDKTVDLKLNGTEEDL